MNGVCLYLCEQIKYVCLRLLFLGDETMWDKSSHVHILTIMNLGFQRCKECLAMLVSL